MKEPKIIKIADKLEKEYPGCASVVAIPFLLVVGGISMGV